MGTLVRDGIPVIIEASGPTPAVQVLVDRADAKRVERDGFCDRLWLDKW